MAWLEITIDTASEKIDSVVTSLTAAGFADLVIEDQEEFDKIDVHTYAQRVFSMYSGKKKRVTIRFINMLLDVAVERFGTKDAQYSAVDDKHFTVTAEVEISDLFFGWLLSFGRRVKILYPSDVLEDFRVYIEKMRDLYMPKDN